LPVPACSSASAFPSGTIQNLGVRRRGLTLMHSRRTPGSASTRMATSRSSSTSPRWVRACGRRSR
jgi:hypothetical protein